MAARSKADEHVTTDHDTIRRWTEARGGKPGAVNSTHRSDDPDILRITNRRPA